MLDVVWIVKEFNCVRVVESAAKKFNARTIGSENKRKKKEIRIILIS